MASKKNHMNNLKINEMIAHFEKKERAHDAIITNSRSLVRRCANAIKMLHYGEEKGAKKELATLESELKKLPRPDASYDYLLAPIMQEVVEAKLLLSAMEHKKLQNYEMLGVEPQVYLLGLCDVIGEFRRQMLEEMKAGNEKEAKYYFELMADCYEQISVIRFSNSVLPNFRRKQDVARGQLEMARSEILRARR